MKHPPNHDTVAPRSVARFALVYLVVSILLVRFESNTAMMTQLADFGALKNDLLNTLYLLHSQPPFLNALLGIGLKLLGPHHALFLQGVQFLLVVVNFVIVRSVLARLGLPRALAYAVLLAPQVLLYQNFPYEPIYTFTAVNAFVWGCVHFEDRRGFAAAVGALAWLGTLHAAFHPVVVLAFLGVVYFYFARTGARPRWSRRFAATVTIGLMAVPCLIVAKNQLLFGVPSMSSWSGCNFASLTTKERGFTTEGLIHRPSGNPVLHWVQGTDGRTNFHHVGMIEKCAAIQKRAVAWVREHPRGYLENVREALWRTESKFSFDYVMVADLWTPLGRRLWRPLNGALDAVRGVPLLIMNLLMPAAFLLALAVGWLGPGARPLAPVALLYLATTTLIHLVNVEDHERMRFRFFFAGCLFGCLLARAAVAAVLHRVGHVSPARSHWVRSDS